MEILPQQSGPLAFGDFLEHLRRQGFTIGVDHHLRLQRLLDALGGRCAPQELKTLLCPVFATNEKEQQSFHRAFDSYYDLFQVPDESEGMIDLPLASAGEQEKSAAESAKSKRRFSLIYTTLTALLITSAILIARSPEAMKLIGLTPTTTPSPPPSPEPSTPPPTTEVSPSETVSPGPTDFGPVVIQTPIPQPRWEDAIDFVVAHRNAIRVAAVVIPLLCFLIYEMIRYRRRKLILERAQGRKPPRAWPIHAPSPELKDYRSERFYKAARGLRRRQVGEFQRLDVARTIAATIEARGYPNFRYRADSRAPEYLILIDRASWRDHQSQLFDALARAMEREGLFTKRYFYDGDPRVCTDDSANRAVHLTDLQKKYSWRRLLIFGDGERLIDPVSGRLSSWAALLLEWPDRALLTPESRRGLREKTLADHFILLPATLEGLGELAERFDLPTVAEFDTWELNGEPAPPEPEGAVNIEALRPYLGEESFQWLCACAVYPELHWDLTLHLGSLPRMGAGLIGEKNLLRLIRFPWFRTGSMPDELRLRLIGELEPERERAVRSAIIELLEKNPAPQGTFAADARKLEIAAQRSWLSRDNRKEFRREVKEVKRFPQSDIVRDYALVRFLESTPSSRLALMLPTWLRKSFYKNGVPAFGLRTVTRVFSAFVVIAAAVVGSSLIPKIPSPPAESYAVVVGVSGVRDRRVLSIEESVSDAELFARHLSSARGGGVKAQNLALITGESATTSSLREAIAMALRERASKQDSVFFYFSGYGTAAKDDPKNLTLITYDFDTAGSYSSAELLRMIRENINHVGRVFIFIDTVNAGLVGDQVIELLRETPEARGKIIALLSCKADQTSFFKAPASNIMIGPFTFSLISGLNGEADANKDGLVTLGEVFPFIQQSVMNATANNPVGKQEPVMAGDMDLNTPLAWPAMPGVDLAKEQRGDIKLPTPSPGVSPTAVGTPPKSPSSPEAQPNPLNFGKVELGRNAVQAVILTNTSPAQLRIGPASINDDQFNEFRIEQNGCQARVLSQGDRCTIRVIYTPQDGGERRATLIIADNSPAQRANVALNGFGVKPAAARASVTPSQLEFGDLEVGGRANERTVTITSVGNEPLQIAGVKLPDASLFRIAADGCGGKSLAPKQDCGVRISFAPGVVGAHRSALLIESNAAESPHRIEISGRAISELTPTQWDFGRSQVGARGQAQSFRITNQGEEPFSRVSVKIVENILGSLPGQLNNPPSYLGGYNFKIEDNRCNVTLKPGENCEITVRFAPRFGGRLRGTLLISFGVRFATALLSGEGVGAQPQPGRGWCCVNGRIENLNSRECRQREGQSYPDEASARRGCRPMK